LNSVLDRHVILDFEEVAVPLTVPTSPRPTPNALLDALGDVVLDEFEARDAVRWKSCAGRPPVGICVPVTRPAALRA